MSEAVNVQPLGGGRVHRPEQALDKPWPACRSYPNGTTRATVYRLVALEVDCVRCETQLLTEAAFAAAAQERADDATAVAGQAVSK